MKKRCCLVLIHLALCFCVFGKTINLEEALRQKLVTPTIVMKPHDDGGGRHLHLSLKNGTKENLTVIIPVGFIFQAADSTVQDFIHVEGKTLHVPALATRGTFLKALCIRASRSCPANGAVFGAKSLASGTLLAVTAFAFEKKLYNLDAMQSALWAITDNKDLVGINNLVLAQFVAQRLNKPLPDYFVNYKHRDVAGETAETALEPLAIKGEFVYTLPADQQVKLDLVDTTGRSVLKDFKMIDIMNQTKGRHRFSFTLELKGVSRGTYFMKMTAVSDGKEWASKRVVF